MRRQYTADDSQPIDSDLNSAEVLSSLPSDWWQTADPGFPSEVLPVASAQPTLPEINQFPAVQDLPSTPFDTNSLQSISADGSTRLNGREFANSGTSISLEGPGLPVSSHSFSEYGSEQNEEQNEDPASANRSSYSGARRPRAPKRRKKPVDPSSKRTEPLACPTCPKTFVRRCELT